MLSARATFSDTYNAYLKDNFFDDEIEEMHTQDITDDEAESERSYQEGDI